MVFVLQVTAMLASVLTTTLGSTKECPKGWFGDNCVLKCHCEKFEACNNNGDCMMTDNCKIGYFGPGCQYLDLLSNFGSPLTESYLRDFDDSTCNHKKTALSIEVFLEDPLPFSWFNIHANDKKYLHNFVVTLNEADVCSSERRYVISELEVHVTCDTNILLSKLLIEGEIAPYACSVYISGGRNVALKQKTNYSSNALRNNTSGMNDPHLAVDGNSDPTSDKGSCAHNDDDIGDAEWHLTFSQPCILLSATVYTSSKYTDRLQGFTLATYSQAGNVTNFYDNTSEPMLIYEMIFYSRIPVISILIKAAPVFDADVSVLTVCELEAYGEIVCPDMMYGLHCNLPCKCDARDICDTVTGKCGPGCQIGSYGFNCSFSCNQNCLNGVCMPQFGHCLRCNPGYLGLFCADACPHGTFGVECLYNCSQHCFSICHHETGYCDCKDGFTGLQCTECPKGRFGFNCTNRCPATCAKPLCDLKTGACTSCHGGRLGPSCEDCPKTFYGSKCYSACSKFCMNRTCSKDNGKCSVCTHGYTGPHCRFAPKTDMHMEYMFAPAGMFAAVIFILCIICLSRKSTKRHSSHPEI